MWGPDQRVGSAELHEAFVAFLAQSPDTSCQQAPSHRELRSLLETQLGLHYCQLYIDGANCRGFKGLGQDPTDALEGLTLGSTIEA